MTGSKFHRSKEFPVGAVVSYIFIIAYTILSVYPFLWMVSATLKEPLEVVTSNSLIPRNPDFTTLIETWQRLDFFLHSWNSLFLTAIVILGTVIIYSLAGYGFAVLPFKGGNIILGFFLSMLRVPGVTVLVPLYVMLRLQVPIIGPDSPYWLTFIGVAIPMINGAGPFAMLLFRNYFKSVPHALHDAAVVDGASELRIYRSIYLPLGLPAIATIAITTFIAAWNAYAWPSIVLTKSEWQTLPLKLRELDLQQVIQWDVRMAGSLFTVLPVIVVFFLLQRYYVAGLTGSIKN
jgi:ABC-type glycerol-3-phosphate transport system permease component